MPAFLNVPEVGVVEQVIVGKRRHRRVHVAVDPALGIGGEVVTHEEGDLLTVWLWWAVPGTALEGAGLIKIAPTGVVSERLTYFNKLEI